MKRIHLVSGPRNVSTALMYSFGNRPDFSIVDEPFYAYYLHTHPEIEHPGRQETLKSQSKNYDEILEDVIFKNYDTPKVFFKNMAHHLDGADWQFMKKMQNILLIRQPRQLIASFARVIPNPTMLDIGLELEFKIMQFFIENEIPFVVIDSGDLREDPENYLRRLCHSLEIPFMDEMLSWEAGSREEDGVWAKYWYANVHKSTGWSKGPLSQHEFPEHLDGLLKEAEYYYDQLRKHKI